MMGAQTVGVGRHLLGSILQAKMPWLTLESDAAARLTKQRNDTETGIFMSGAALPGARDTNEEIARCMTCPYPECCNCLERSGVREKKRRQTAKELADSLRICKCEEVGAK